MSGIFPGTRDQRSVRQTKPLMGFIYWGGGKMASKKHMSECITRCRLIVTTVEEKWLRFGEREALKVVVDGSPVSLGK